jgi:hypothetical protein
LDAISKSEVGQGDLLDKVHNRSFTGAVTRPDGRVRPGDKLSFPENHDKAVAQMSFVSQIILPFAPGVGTGNIVKFRKNPKGEISISVKY